jgi:hypothetical protein
LSFVSLPEQAQDAFRTTSKTYPRPQLKRTWAAGAEDLIEAARRLPEREPVSEIAAVVGKVRGIVEVEYFADELKTPPIAQRERPAQPQIKGVEIIAKPVTIRRH